MIKEESLEYINGVKDRNADVLRWQKAHPFVLRLEYRNELVCVGCYETAKDLPCDIRNSVEVKRLEESLKGCGEKEDK